MNAVVPELVAPAGAFVTCEAGHRIYRVVRDLTRCRGLKAQDYESVHPDVPSPVAHERIPCLCPCGEVFAVRTGWNGHQFHFEGLGWRP